MGWTPPGGIEMCQGSGCCNTATRRASMYLVSIIGLDLAKNVFQAHGAGADRSVAFRRKLSRAQLLKFLSC
jgi:hypothetical protein